MKTKKDATLTDLVDGLYEDLAKIEDNRLGDATQLFISKVIGGENGNSGELLNLFNGDHDFLRAVFHALMTTSLRDAKMPKKTLAIVFRDLITELLADPETRKILSQTMRLLEEDPVMVQLLYEGEHFVTPEYVKRQLQ